MATNTDTVQSLEKALRILRAFSEEKRHLGITELSKMLGFSKTATFRLVTTLALEGFLMQSEDSKYSIGRNAFQVGCLYKKADVFQEYMKPVLRRLRDRTNCTVQLCMLDGEDILVLSYMEGGTMIRIISSAGTRLPIHSTAAGKAILAAMNLQERDEWVEMLSRKRSMQNVSAQPSLFKAHLDEVKKAGYATSDGEYSEQLFAMGVHIPMAEMEERYAIAIITLRHMVTPQMQALFKSELSSAASRAQQECG